MPGNAVRAAIAAAFVMTSLLAVGERAAAQTLNDLTQTCAACHGEAGVPTEKTTPVIWGQPRAYLLNQLNDFKIGRRKNEIMSGVAESLSKQDMEALATYYSQQQWPDLQQPAPSPEDRAAADAVVNSLNCRGCHQANYQGDTVRPRLAGQQDEYLLKTMTDFHTGERRNYIGMVVLMKSLDEAQLKPVANYLASLRYNGRPK
ncbi:c-type cytochrome [Hyphomicrobium sp.]|uniref:c-type cytochrome n=1 Tax=Hyphomicrobium sp. TaxID=82 RepID=UPI002D768BA9|nr:c-type cytochrome [Hyphomicrobium sp.]HET6388253.1 c-type cytochrome [Hyphomicrobium sp.]